MIKISRNGEQRKHNSRLKDTSSEAQASGKESRTENANGTERFVNLEPHTNTNTNRFSRAVVSLTSRCDSLKQPRPTV